MDGYGQSLGIVAAGTASHGQDEVRLVLPGQGDAFPELVHRRVGHDPGNLRHLLACFRQHPDHLVIDAVPFDGTPAVYQHHPAAVFVQLHPDVFQGPFAEEQFGGIAVRKIS